MPQSRYRYGVLLPHFGTHASRERLLEGARQIERYGFDAVLVRDHVVFHPHKSEDQDRTHVDPFAVLNAIAAITSRVTLMTGTLIPHRHPIHTALSLGSLDFMAGPGRVIAGFGIGTFDHEFEAVGMGGWDRREVLREQVEIMRKLWTGETVSHQGTYYQFTDVDIQPVPSSHLPIWYGGTSLAAVRRSVEYCDGWMPGRTPRRDLTKLLDRLRRLAGEADKPVPTTAIIPYVSPGRTYEQATQDINVPAILHEAAKYTPPASGRFETLDDLDGSVIAGPPEKIVEETRKYQATGIDYMIFDMRLRFADWEDCLQMLGEEVLPELQRGDGAGPGGTVDREQVAASPLGVS